MLRGKWFPDSLSGVACCTILLLVVAAALASCDRNDSADQGSRVGAGFLPTATPVPRAPGAVEGFYGWCPPLPRVMCPQPGDTFNPYRDLALEHVAQIDGHGYKAQSWWVLDPDEVDEIVMMFDAEVRVEERDLASRADEDGSAHVLFQFTWAPGFGPFGSEDGRRQRVDFDGDLSRNTVAFGLVEWQVPQEFFGRFALYMSEVSPTPEASATPTPEIVPAGSVYFTHPDDPLEWDGDAERVTSGTGGHCEWPELTTEFGIPSLIIVEEGLAFWAISPTRRDPAWRWTGYSHEQWEIWQGSDPETIYIVTRDDERIAFEYRSFGCI